MSGTNQDYKLAGKTALLKEKASGNYVHYRPENRTYTLSSGPVGACSFDGFTLENLIHEALGKKLEDFEIKILSSPRFPKKPEGSSAG
jgi:hypothetical protein